MSLSLRTSLVSSKVTVRRPLIIKSTKICRARTRRVLLIENKTIWQLDLDKRWCKQNAEKCARIQEKQHIINLSNLITQKFENLSEEEEDKDFTVFCHKTGIEIKFESVGVGHPLDSPSQLYVTDIGSSTEIFVNNKKTKKGEKYHLCPGSSLRFGDIAQFQVMRDVCAHA